jgi:predicted dehydrogenase
MEHPPRKKLKAGIIGVGDISMMHAPGYVDFDRAELHAIADIDQKLLERRKKEWQVEKCYTDYRKLLADPEIDLVEIITPHHLHKPMVLDAAKAGKHVSVQKPMSISVREADEMIEATGKAGVKFKVFENFVFYPPYVKAKELLDAGEIGEPLSIRFKLGTGLLGMRRSYPVTVELWHLLEVEKGMGQAVFDDGYHKLSLAIHFIGEIERVRGWIDRSFVFADMPAMLMWHHKDSQCLGYFDTAFSPSMYVKSKYFSADERVDITGTRGWISVSRCTGQLLDVPALVMCRDGKRYLFDDLRADWLDSFMDSCRHFVDCILEDKEPLLTGERGKKIVQFAYACIKAAKDRCEVKPDEII